METFLKVTVSGTIGSAGEQADFAGLLRRVSDEYGLYRLLLDERRVRKHIDTLEAYHLAEAEISAEAAVRGVRMACLPHPGDMQFARTMETLLRNRSISYRAFSDPDEAEAWLTR